MYISTLKNHLNKRSLVQYGLPAIAYLFLAAILIKVFAVNPTANVAIHNAATPSPIVERNLNIISTWHLFGMNPTTTFKKVKDTNIQLLGIIYKNNDSQVIMMVDSKQNLFKNGDKIGAYTIQKIERNRVLVATHEGVEEIELFGKFGEIDSKATEANNTAKSLPSFQKSPNYVNPNQFRHNPRLKGEPSRRTP